MDLVKEFSKKTSVNFYRKRFKNIPAQIAIRGGHPDAPGALKGEHVVRIMMNGPEEMQRIAAELGYTGVEFVDFVVEHFVVSNSDNYGSDIDQDFFYMSAKERLPGQL